MHNYLFTMICHVSNPPSNPSCAVGTTPFILVIMQG